MNSVKTLPALPEKEKMRALLNEFFKLVKNQPEFQDRISELQMLALEQMMPFFQGTGVIIDGKKHATATVGLNLFRNYPHRERWVEKALATDLRSVSNKSGGPDGTADLEYKSGTFKGKKLLSESQSIGSFDKVDDPKNSFDKRFNKKHAFSIFPDDSVPAIIAFVATPKELNKLEKAYIERQNDCQNNISSGRRKRDSFDISIGTLIAIGAKVSFLDLDYILDQEIVLSDKLSEFVMRDSYWKGMIAARLRGTTEESDSVISLGKKDLPLRRVRLQQQTKNFMSN